MPQRLGTRMVLAALCLLPVAPPPARAGNIEVSPVSVELPPDRPAAVLTVTNHGAGRTAVQVRGFAWSQTATDDALARTDDLLVSPPQFQLGPEEAQTVRILLRRPSAGAEGSYRLLLDELPVGKEPGAVQFALRLSLPVFAVPAGRTASRLSWRVVSTPAGAELRAANGGARRDRVVGLQVVLPGGTTAKPADLPNPYVLPGVERRWHVALDRAALRAARGAGSVRVTGMSDFGRIDAAVPVQEGP